MICQNLEGINAPRFRRPFNVEKSEKRPKMDEKKNLFLCQESELSTRYYDRLTQILPRKCEYIFLVLVGSLDCLISEVSEVNICVFNKISSPILV